MTTGVVKRGIASSPIWLLPAAMSFVGFFQNVFSFGSSVAALCRDFLIFFRVVWERLFEGLGPSSPFSIDESTSDLLTLWVTCSLAIWFLPLITRQTDGRTLTTVSAVKALFRVPTIIARPVSFLLIALSIATVIAPFGAFSDAAQSKLFSDMASSDIVRGYGLGDWLSSGGVWLAGLFVVAAGALLSYNFFAIGPRLEKAVLSKAERFDLVVIAIGLWLISATFLVLAIMTAPSPGGGSPKFDLMVLSLLTLAGLVAWRSALPFVQLVVLAGVIFAIDGAYSFMISVSSSAQGG